MKNIILSLLVVLTLSSFSYSAELSETTRWNLYNAEKKDPGFSAVGAFLFPTVGHAIAGDWPRGLLFLIPEGTAIFLLAQSKGNDAVGGATAALVIFRVWEIFDAYSTAEETNKDLRKKYNLGVSLYNGSPVLVSQIVF